jgi:integrase
MTKYTGVVARGDSVLIDFTYNGERCRETLRTKPTKTALRDISRKREAILHSIAMGSFDYADHFPNSPKAIKYSKRSGDLISIESALKKWLKGKETRCQFSTIKDYNSIIYHHLIPEFGDISLSELESDDVNDWINILGISNKRINNVLSPLRQTLFDAFIDGHIDRNPMDRVKALPLEQQEPNPFNQYERGAVLSQLLGQEKNLILFAFWSGLRSSELIGLRWKDIDFDNNRLYVRKAMVRRREKSTKTTSGLRTVELNEQSTLALKSQLDFTKGQLRIFHDPKYNLPWADDQVIRKRVWKPAIKAAQIEYRSPYKTRHTFASMMLSQGKNPMWVAQQMGHKDWGMIRKVYGRWIPPD